jgi:hypothetical protein
MNPAMPPGDAPVGRRRRITASAVAEIRANAAVPRDAVLGDLSALLKAFVRSLADRGVAGYCWLELDEGGTITLRVIENISLLCGAYRINPKKLAAFGAILGGIEAAEAVAGERASFHEAEKCRGFLPTKATKGRKTGEAL